MGLGMRDGVWSKMMREVSVFSDLTEDFLDEVVFSLFSTML